MIEWHINVLDYRNVVQEWFRMLFHKRLPVQCFHAIHQIILVPVHIHHLWPPSPTIVPSLNPPS